MALDAYLSSIPDRKAKSVRALPRILREAYTYNVPALIMKSSTDRLSVDGDYFFFPGDAGCLPEKNRILAYHKEFRNS